MRRKSLSLLFSVLLLQNCIRLKLYSLRLVVNLIIVFLLFVKAIDLFCIQMPSKNCSAVTTGECLTSSSDLLIKDYLL